LIHAKIGKVACRSKVFAANPAWTGKRQKKKPDFRPAPLRTKRLKIFATALAANFIVGAAPQTYALHHTRNTAFLHLNDVMRITQAKKASSHHFWGHGVTGDFAH
jgi:hypothetical protein